MADAVPRVAIVATSAVEASGLPAMLVVELPKVGGLEMVERAEVGKLIEENAVQRMFAADAVVQRRSAGTLLAADVLLLLSRETIEARECWKVILAEPRNGTRLRAGLLPASTSLEESSREIARMTRETIVRFPAGAKTIVGVGPLLSRTLVHDYDPLQGSLGWLLENALSSAPGVAVIEMEEADALRQEANVVGDGEASRVVPLFVRGEFTVPAGPGAPVFRLSIEISDGARVLERIAPAPLGLPELAGFISREVSAKILALAQSGAPRAFSREAEFAVLVARAEEFARAGANRYSAGLREAAVLLRDSDAQRRLLVREYCALMQSAMHGVYREPLQKTVVEEAKQRAFGSWRAACSHLDFLTANRRIDAREYIALAEQIAAAQNQITGDASGPVEQFKTERNQRLLATLPVVLDLPLAVGDRAPPQEQRQRLLQLTLSSVIGRRKADLDTLAAILERIPDEFPPSAELTYFLSDVSERSGAANSGDGRAEFLEKLKRSSRPLNRIYARYSALFGQYYSRPKTIGPALLADVEALISDYRAWCDARQIPDFSREPLTTKMTDLAGYIKTDLTPATAVPVLPRPRPPIASTGRLQITELDLQLKTLAGGTEAFGKQTWPVGTGFLPVSQLYRCNDQLDVFWSPGAILFQRSRGLLEEVVLDGAAYFEDVAWDGAQLWIATRRRGLWRLDPETREILKIGGDSGLPPADKGMRLHALAPGEVCAIGSFGELQRAWCAIVEAQPRPAVKVFHTATRVLTAADDREGDSARAADIVFSPSWVHLYESMQGGHRLMVGRYGPSRASRATPLEIDLETLRVGLSPFALTAADLRSSAAYFSKNGELLEAGDSHVAHFAAPGKKFDDGQSRHAICTPRNSEGVENGGLRGLLLPSDGCIYVPGLMWFRIDPRTMQAEQLTPERLPAPASEFEHFGVSAHFGLVAWKYRGAKFYQISVGAETAVEKRLP